MAIREFDGVDDIITVSAGSASVAGAYSIVVVAKPTNLASAVGFFGLLNGTTLLGSLADGGGGKLGDYTNVLGAEGGVGMTAGDWQIIALSKAAGTTHPTFHRKALGSGSWTHTPGVVDNIPDNATAVTTMQIGAMGAAFPKACRMGTVAFFTAELSDANIESIQTTPATQTLKNLGASDLWDLNQASIATAVPDLVGSANQTAITGTTAVTGDDPPGWTFGLGGSADDTLSGASDTLAGTRDELGGSSDVLSGPRDEF